MSKQMLPTGQDVAIPTILVTKTKASKVLYTHKPYVLGTMGQSIVNMSSSPVEPS